MFPSNIAKYCLSLLLLLTTSCSDDDQLFVVCPEFCYTGPEDTKGVGRCTAGVPTCDSDGNVLRCTGDIIPALVETCNGIDDDCNGWVDDKLIHHPNTLENNCKACGPCSWTREVCEAGAWKCLYHTAPLPDDSTCDGVDNDCDCQVDEDVIQNEELVFCYSGPSETVNNGLCRPGIESCTDGALRCDGEIVPKDEACNGVDDDCNGWVDDITDYYQGIDIIFAIDMSGSMGPYVEAVANVVCDYAEATEGRNDVTTKMGLVLIAVPDGNFSLGYNLTDAETLCQVLQDTALTGGSEPTISAAKAVVSPLNPLGILWTTSAKRIFIGFGDESAQIRCLNGSDCNINDEVAETVAFCATTNTDVYWFLGGSHSFYDTQATSCNGKVFGLTSYEEYMRNDLNSILEEVCLEDPDE